MTDSTSSAWPAAFTLRKVFLMMPSGPMTKVVRSTPMYFPAIHGFLLPHAISLADFVVFIGHKGKGEIELCGELLMGFRGIGADAEHHGVFRDDLLVRVAQFAGLGRATRCIVLGIEVEHDGFASVLGEFLECRGFVAFAKFFHV